MFYKMEINNYWKLLIILFVWLLLLSGCNTSEKVQPTQPTQTQVPSPTMASPLENTSVLEPSETPNVPIPTTTETQVPTPSPIPTAITTPTPTILPSATPNLPLLPGTPQPAGLLPISPLTAPRLVQSGVLSKGVIRDFLWAEDGTIHILTSIGYFSYQQAGAIPDRQVLIDWPFSDGKLSADGSILALVHEGQIQIFVTDGFKSHGILDLSDNGWVYGCALSRDGKLVAAGDVFGKISIFGTDDLKLLASTSRQGDSLDDLVFSPDGKLLVSVTQDNGIVTVFDTADGQSLFTPSSGADEITGVVFSPKGSLIYGSSISGKIYVWSAENGHPVRSFSAASSEPIAKISLSPDGKSLLYTGLDRRMRFIGTEDGKLLNAIQYDASLVQQTAFSPDGTYFLTFTETGHLYFWEIGAQEPAYSLDGFWYPIDFSTNDETMLTISTGGLQFWRWPDLGYQQPLDIVPFEEIKTVAISRDGSTIALGLDDGTIYILDSSFEPIASSPLQTASSNVGKVMLSPDGSRIAAQVFYAGRGSRLLTREGDILLQQPSGSGFNHHPVFSGDGRYVALSPHDNTVAVFDTSDGSQVASLAITDGYVRFESLVLSADGSLVVAGADTGEVFIWDAASGNLLHRWNAHPDGQITAVAINTQDSILATGGLDGIVILWDLKTYEALSTFHAHGGSVKNIAFTPDNTRMVTQGTDGVLRIWAVLP